MRFLLLPLCVLAAMAAQFAGANTAPVTLEVFSDYQCPSCRTLHMEVVKQLMDDYVAKGKVYLIHRDFPLPMHPYGRTASEWANAAAKIGKFQQVADVLYLKQAVWSKDGAIEPVVAAVLKPAEVTKLKAHLKDADIKAAIDADVVLGQKARVNQTPTMVFTHRLRSTPISGVINYSLVKGYIDELLKK